VTQAATAPGAVLSIRLSGAPATVACTGMASIELAVPVGEATAFNVGSVAKQITARLVIRAARDQTISLRQPVSDLLPEFRPADVTVADLITHHGGVRDAESLLSLAGFRDLDHYTARDLLALAFRQRHRAAPRGQFLYSNTGYLLLAEILRRTRGATLREIAAEQVFGPLGMTSTHFQEDPRDVIPGAAASYTAVPGGWRRTQRPVSIPGPGTLWSTAADLGLWLARLHQERGKDLPSAQDIPYQPSDHAPFTYGPGLYADPEGAAVFHNGHEQGFSAATRLNPDGTQVICLSNHAEIPADRLASAALASLTRDQRADPASILAAAAPGTSNGACDEDHPAPGTRHQAVGTYRSDEVPGTLRLTRGGGHLYLWRRGTAQRLVPLSPQTHKGEGCTLVFPADPGNDPPRSFTLDLDRAPGLQYTLKSDSLPQP